MLNDILNTVSAQWQSMQLFMVCINIIIHMLFAAAVAKDSGSMQKRGCPTIMVSGVTWSFATLFGGIFIATIYWLLHHSTLTKS